MLADLAGVLARLRRRTREVVEASFGREAQREDLVAFVELRDRKVNRSVDRQMDT